MGATNVYAVCYVCYYLELIKKNVYCVIGTIENKYPSAPGEHGKVKPVYATHVKFRIKKNKMEKFLK